MRPAAHLGRLASIRSRIPLADSSYKLAEDLSEAFVDHRLKTRQGVEDLEHYRAGVSAQVETESKVVEVKRALTGHFVLIFDARIIA